MGVASVSILMQWGLVGEAIDYNEYLTGKRTDGSIYGTFNLSRRIGQTIGNSAAVLALGWIGYDASAAVQTAGVLTGIKVLTALVPGIFVIGSWHDTHTFLPYGRQVFFQNLNGRADGYAPCGGADAQAGGIRSGERKEVSLDAMATWYPGCFHSSFVIS